MQLMNKILLFVAALFFCSTVDVYAQASYGPLEIGDSSEHYVFTNKAMVRALPNMSSSVIDTLYAGNLVLVRNVAVSKDLPKETNNQWVYINYAKEGIFKDGYIWVGLLSFDALRRGNVKFIYGVEDVTERRLKQIDGDYTEYRYSIQLKVLRNDTLIAIDTFTADRYFAMTEITNGSGLDSVKNIISISFGGGACGVGMFTYIHLWNDKSLYVLPKLFQVSDAGVYHDVQRFIYPADKGGKQGLILWEEEEASAKENTDGEFITDKNGEPLFDVRIKHKTYTWDGKKLHLCQ